MSASRPSSRPPIKKAGSPRVQPPGRLSTTCWSGSDLAAGADSPWTLMPGLAREDSTLLGEHHRSDHGRETVVWTGAASDLARQCDTFVGSGWGPRFEDIRPVRATHSRARSRRA